MNFIDPLENCTSESLVLLGGALFLFPEDKILPRKGTPASVAARPVISASASCRRKLEEKPKNMCYRHIFEYNIGVFVCGHKIKRNNFIL